MNSAVFFDDTYPADLQAEGLAVREAIMLGKCAQCPDLVKCSTDKNFKFPPNAFCMVKKQEILKQWQ